MYKELSIILERLDSCLDSGIDDLEFIKYHSEDTTNSDLDIIDDVVELAESIRGIINAEETE